MPPVSYQEIAERFRHCTEERKDPLLIASMIAQSVGMCDENGRKFFTESGGPKLNPDRAKRVHSAGDFRFDTLAEVIIGRQWREVFGLDNSNSMFPTRDLINDAARGGLIREESAAPIGPSMWGNVAAWTTSIGGLLGARFNEGYETAPYDCAEIFPVLPGVFYQGGERWIDIYGPWMPAQPTGPGEEYPDNTMSAIWSEASPAQKFAGKITLTKEMLTIDISGGQFMAKAAKGGETLKFRESEDSISLLTGQVNNWKLGMLPDLSATSYVTYGATITGPTNVRTLTNNNINPFNDPGAIQKSNEYLSNLYDPITDYPMNQDMSVAIFPEPLADFANAINASSEFRLLNQGTAGPEQQAPGQFPTDMVNIMNPWRGAIKRAIASRWLWKRLTGSTTPQPGLAAGLGLSGAAAYRWYRLDPAKAACRRQMWAPTSTSISPNDYVMATQGILAAFAWDMSMNLNVRSGYAFQQNKGA